MEISLCFPTGPAIGERTKKNKGGPVLARTLRFFDSDEETDHLRSLEPEEVGEVWEDGPLS